MRQIHVLDAFTNGHEAAREFIRRQGWSEDQCEIIFCVTHENIFRKLFEGPSYAVVPISNTLIGPVKEILDASKKYREDGYNMEIRDQFDLKVNHCLMVPQGIKKLEDVRAVMSKPEALRQCSDFLDQLKIPEAYRGHQSSTGAAAKQVGKMMSTSPIAAIAPRAAAEEYGLTVLAENIQNDSRKPNYTTFVLIENECRVEPRKVGIIGVNGGVGKVFERLYKSLGCEVVGSDAEKPTGWTNEEVVSYAEVVIFAVPIRDTPKIIESVAHLVRADQLLMDVTSVKEPAVTAMLQTRAQVVGLHPMFRPDIPFKGQTIVVCLSHFDEPKWKTWAVNMLATMRAKIKHSSPSVHDEYMPVVQVAPHSSNLMNALLMTRQGLSVTESLDFTSPSYRIALAQMGRLLGQGAKLYSDIIIENPSTVRMLKELMRIVAELIETVEEKDYARLEGMFAEAKTHFGDEVIKESDKLFTRIVSLSTLYNGNSVTLEFTKEENKPGLLERVLHAFSTRGVNLTGIHNVPGKTTDSITMSFESSKDSDEVRRALDELEWWQDPKMTVHR